MKQETFNLIMKLQFTITSVINSTTGKEREAFIKAKELILQAYHKIEEFE